jgi:thiol-disulfide isomerase/thioredoxin
MYSLPMLGTLLEAGVLTEEGDGVRLTERFLNTVERNRVAVDSADAENPLSALGLDPTGPMAGLDADDLPFIVEYAALAELVSDATLEDLVRWTVVLDQFRVDGPQTRGSPEPFLPVSVEKLPTCLSLFSPAIVYVWKDDCEPCDLVRDDLENLFDGTAENMALFSVYGPADSVLLQERYDVMGGPTVLFMIEGRVDARLVGAHSRSTLESEVDILRELA